MKILISYRGIPQSPGWATGDFVVKAFRQLGHEVYPYGNYYESDKMIDDNTFEKLINIDFDLYLQMECGDGDRFYGECASFRCKKRASWWFDIALYPERWKRETALVSSDMNFIANRNFIYDLPKTYYLPYAADFELHHRSLQVPKIRDVALIGSDRPDRRQLIDALKEKGIDAHLISGIFREQYVDALASTKIIVNDIAGGGSGLLPMRYFEAPAAGSYLLTINDNIAEHALDIATVIGHYKDAPMLAFQCRALLDNQVVLADFTQLQQSCILQHHTYRNRCQEILNIILN
jgi:Glycosyl transferases group 1